MSIYQIKPRLSDIIKHQEWCVDIFLKMMKSPCGYPLDKEPTSDEEILALLEPADPKYIETSEELKEWQQDSVDSFKELKGEMEKKYNLADIQLDISNAIIVLGNDHVDEYLLEDHKLGDNFVLLGEIPQATGHLVVTSMQNSNVSAKILTMVHSYNFFVARPIDV